MMNLKPPAQLAITRASLMGADPPTKAERVSSFILSHAEIARTLRELVALRKLSPHKDDEADKCAEYLVQQIEQDFMDSFGVNLFPGGE